MKGTIRARGRDTWQLAYDLPPGPDGKRRQRTKTVRGPKKAAQIRLREVLSQVDQGRSVDPGKMTVGKYFGDWLDGLTIAPSSIERYELNIRVHIKPELGNIRLAHLTALQLETFYHGKTRQPIERIGPTSSCRHRQGIGPRRQARPDCQESCARH